MGLEEGFYEVDGGGELLMERHRLHLTKMLFHNPNELKHHSLLIVHFFLESLILALDILEFIHKLKFISLDLLQLIKKHLDLILTILPTTIFLPSHLPVSIFS